MTQRKIASKRDGARVQATRVIDDGFESAECESKEEIHPGDVITCPPDKKHWHGATDATAMTHIAIQASKNGKNVDWLEHVSDDQYRS